VQLLQQQLVPRLDESAAADLLERRRRVELCDERGVAQVEPQRRREARAVLPRDGLRDGLRRLLRG